MLNPFALEHQADAGEQAWPRAGIPLLGAAQQRSTTGLEYVEKILISACLLGEPVRYDGRAVILNSDLLNRWQQEGRLIAICPEVAGGLPTPRTPAELQSGDGAALLAGQAKVVDREGKVVSDAFQRGAEAALASARRHGCRMAILKAKSPSCGNAYIYDGSFQGRLVVGAGVTAALLQQAGIRVFNEEQLDAAQVWLKRLEEHPA